MPKDNLVYGILILFACVFATVCGFSIYQGITFMGIFCGFFAVLLTTVVIFCKLKKGKRNENNS